MRLRKSFHAAAIIIALLAFGSLSASAQIFPAVPTGKPAASVDLATAEGVKAVTGEWRYSDTKIVETEFRLPGADGQPSEAPAKTYDYTPHAGGADFDDSRWEVIAPEALSKRRGAGRLSFNWYRIRLTVPERVGGFDTTGSTLVFETSLDDYAEVWVDGELVRATGQRGGSVVGGWEAAKPLVCRRDGRAGRPIPPTR